MNQNKYKIYLAVSLVLFASTGLFLLNDGHNWGGDFALYLEEADSLLHGGLKVLFLENSFTVEHSHRYLSPILYPLGYPIFLTLPVLVFGKTFWFYKVLNIFLLVYLGWRFFQLNRHFNLFPKWAIISWILLFLFKDTLFFQLEIIGPDILFLVLLVEAIYALYNGKMLITSILTIMLLITRDAGIIFWIVFNIYGLYYKNISSLLAVILGAFLLFVTKDFASNHWNYFLDSIDIEIFTRNLERFYLQYTESFIPLNRFKNVFSRLIVTFILFCGLVLISRPIINKYLRKHLRDIIWSKELGIFGGLCVYVFVHLFWNSLDTRMLFIVELLLNGLFVMGWVYIFRLITEFLKQWQFKFSGVLAAKILFLLLMVMLISKHTYRSYNWCYHSNSVFGDKVKNEKTTQVWKAISYYTEPNAIVVFRKPRVLRYFTDRRSCTRLDSAVLNLAKVKPVYRLTVKGLNYAKSENAVFVKIWSDGENSLERVLSQ